MKTSEVYQQVRHTLNTELRGIPFICLRLVLDPRIPQADGLRARKIIEERMFPLGKHPLELWLYEKRLIAYSHISEMPPEMQEQMRLYRLRWLEALIVEFQAKGD
jgi:hypothetical protein